MSEGRRATRRVLLVGLSFTDRAPAGVEIENLGLCSPSVDRGRAAFPLYEYDTIVINPASYSHFLFGRAGPHSGASNELLALKHERDDYDIDTVFDGETREREMDRALADGTTVVWCLTTAERQRFFGFRTTTMGYAAPAVASVVARARPLLKKGRRLGAIHPRAPFAGYLASLTRGGWSVCLSAHADGLTSIASTPDGLSLGGRVEIDGISGWLLTPPTTPEAETYLVRDAIDVGSRQASSEAYHDVFLSHTSADKPFVRRLRLDLLARGVGRVWLDEAEIQIGDSLIAKIEEGMALCRYVAVVLSPRSIDSGWVRRELDVALDREIARGETVVLPLLYERCEVPSFLRGKLYADFSDPDGYDAVLDRLLQRLRIA